MADLWHVPKAAVQASCFSGLIRLDQVASRSPSQLSARWGNLAKVEHLRAVHVLKYRERDLELLVVKQSWIWRLYAAAVMMTPRPPLNSLGMHLKAVIVVFLLQKFICRVASYDAPKASIV